MALRLIQSIRSQYSTARKWARDTFGKENRQRVSKELRDALSSCLPRRNRRSRSTFIEEEADVPNYVYTLKPKDLLQRELRACINSTIKQDVNWTQTLHTLFKEDGRRCACYFDLRGPLNILFRANNTRRSRVLNFPPNSVIEYNIDTDLTPALHSLFKENMCNNSTMKPDVNWTPMLHTMFKEERTKCIGYFDLRGTLNILFRPTSSRRSRVINFPPNSVIEYDIDTNLTPALHSLFKEKKPPKCFGDFDLRGPLAILLNESPDTTSDFLTFESVSKKDTISKCSGHYFVQIFADSLIVNGPSNDTSHPNSIHKSILKTANHNRGQGDSVKIKKVKFSSLTSMWHFEQLYERVHILPKSELEAIKEEWEDNYVEGTVVAMAEEAEEEEEEEEGEEAAKFKEEIILEEATINMKWKDEEEVYETDDIDDIDDIEEPSIVKFIDRNRCLPAETRFEDEVYKEEVLMEEMEEEYAEGSVAIKKEEGESEVAKFEEVIILEEVTINNKWEDDDEDDAEYEVAGIDDVEEPSLLRFSVKIQWLVCNFAVFLIVYVWILDFLGI